MMTAGRFIIGALCAAVVVLAGAVAWLAIAASHDRGTIAGLQAAQARQARQVAAVVAQSAGVHRDLITCGDLQALISAGYVASDYIDNAGNLQSTPGTLPGHCINR